MKNYGTLPRTCETNISTAYGAALSTPMKTTWRETVRAELETIISRRDRWSRFRIFGSAIRSSAISRVAFRTRRRKGLLLWRTRSPFPSRYSFSNGNFKVRWCCRVYCRLLYYSQTGEAQFLACLSSKVTISLPLLFIYTVVLSDCISCANLVEQCRLFNESRKN
jgi:hypothetical protein